MDNLFDNMIKYGVPNTENTNIRDYVSPEYPLTVPFYVNVNTTKISTAVMTYKYNLVEKFVNDTDQAMSITVCINGNEVVTVNDTVDLLDICQWVVPGWNKMIICSDALIKIVGNISVRSFIKF